MIWLLPLLAGYAGAAACPIERIRPRRPWQPPPWVFGVVWPPLFLTLGAALARTPEAPALWALALCLAGWPPTRSPACAGAPESARTLVVVAAMLAASRLPENPELAPLTLWLAFASTL